MQKRARRFDAGFEAKSVEKAHEYCVLQRSLLLLEGRFQIRLSRTDCFSRSIGNGQHP
jgi:hypothetical protein